MPEYFIYRASQILNCSFIELDSHPDKARLMELAFTFSQGDNQGEYLRELNPEWQRQKKSMTDKISKVSK